MDYTVIMRVRHQFGDSKLDRNEALVDTEAPFVGAVAEFAFSCPNVDASSEAILQLAHRASNQHLVWPGAWPAGGSDVYVRAQGITPEHPVYVNGKELFGGIPASPRGEYRNWMPLWSTRLLIIQPGVLAEKNTLRIESTSIGGNVDNFTVDNVVVFFKSGDRNYPPGGRDTLG